MDIETFRKRFVKHSDEELIVMVTKNASKYNPDAILVAKEILTERNVDIETILNDENAKKVDNSFKTEKEYIESLSAIDQMQYLSEKRAEFEENIEEIVESNNADLTDEELLANFEEILDIVMKTGSFGDLSDIHSKENYYITSNIIAQRNIKTPFLLNIKIDFVNMIATRDVRKKCNKYIFFGFILIALGVIFTVGTEGNMIFYGAVLSGLGLLIAGIRGKMQIKRYYSDMMEAYS
ncbi:hypothetical protein [Flavobacterium sp. Root186]|uniref:hypothetical protein n=1 Tax=Flavobacterium sp. Root186 TaxID=1736485 RepID=UPI0006F48EA1|nr:hypothetical protein [Flavobacterium sp. Root186]KRB53618.1 hypothetical protein ASD98_21770 [Flavobacterium sp. Root186]